MKNSIKRFVLAPIGVLISVFAFGGPAFANDTGYGVTARSTTNTSNMSSVIVGNNGAARSLSGSVAVNHTTGTATITRNGVNVDTATHGFTNSGVFDRSYGGHHANAGANATGEGSGSVAASGKLDNHNAIIQANSNSGNDYTSGAGAGGNGKAVSMSNNKTFGGAGGVVHFTSSGVSVLTSSNGASHSNVWDQSSRGASASAGSGGLSTNSSSGYGVASHSAGR